ncbi:hypothetical protein [Ferribacterium limneticum]|uniref:hypothetical protein n=1 Tax=Ferribacterium limneticum TaxID=76259 RepID=UPI001CF935F6|nr:hypothetical protein [Ferribacterium limneticum]UCV17639.1 hypothetical protein KI610_12485 [Ferribacterium limneticum]
MRTISNTEVRLDRVNYQVIGAPLVHDNQVGQYLEYIRKLYERISEREQHTGITRWALLAGLAYMAWQSVPMLAIIKEAEPSWTYLWLISSYLTTITFFTHHLYQSLSVSRHASPYDFRQVNATASAGSPLSLLIIIVSFSPGIFLSYLAWRTVPELSDLNYRFLNLTTWSLSVFAVLLSGAVLYNDRYIKKNGFMPPFILAANKQSISIFIFQIVFPLFFIGTSVYFFSISINKIPSAIFEPVLLLSGSIALIAPIAEVVLSGIRRQERLSVLATLERDILMHDLSAEEIKIRLEDDFIGCELGDWAKRQVELVRAAHTSISTYCKDAQDVLLQVSQLDPSLRFERIGRIKQCVKLLDSKIDELNGCWEPLNAWLIGCKSQPFLDPYIAQIVEGTLADLSPLMQTAVRMARNSLELLKKRLEELES